MNPESDRCKEESQREAPSGGNAWVTMVGVHVFKSPSSCSIFPHLVRIFPSNNWSTT